MAVRSSSSGASCVCIHVYARLHLHNAFTLIALTNAAVWTLRAKILAPPLLSAEEPRETYLNISRNADMQPECISVEWTDVRVRMAWRGTWNRPPDEGEMKRQSV